MSDLKVPRGAQRSRRIRQDASRRSSRAEAWEEFKDLSSFGDEELIRESRREVVRRSRDNRRAARANGFVDRWERVVVVRLLVFCAGVSSAVVLVGLAVVDAELVRTGLAGLCAACGLGLYRLRDVLRH
jgi:hypothetical protein